MKKVHNTLLASGRSVPLTRLCEFFGVARSSAYYEPRQRRKRPIDEAIAARIKRIHREEPACGVRGTWSRLRFIEGIEVNRKKVHRIKNVGSVPEVKHSIGKGDWLSGVESGERT